MNSATLLSRTIGISRFPMMVLVVFIHSYLQGYDVPVAAFDLMYYISHTLARVAVPMFFFISGFLFFYNKDATAKGFYVSQLKKRVPTLLVPYLLWNTLAFIFNWGKTLPAMAKYFPRMAGTTYGFTDFLQAYGPFTLTPCPGPLMVYDPSSAPADVPLWFLRDLMAVMLFAPLLYILLKGRRGYLCIGLLAVCFIFGVWPEHCFWFSLTGVCFFAAGAFMGINSLDFVKLFGFGHIAKGAMGWGMLFALFSLCRVFYRDAPFANILLALSIMTGLCSFVLICACLGMRDFKPWGFLTKATFFMYAFHGLLISIVIKLVVQIINPFTSIQYILAYFTVAALLTGVSLVAYYCLSRLAPGLANILSGKRL